MARKDLDNIHSYISRDSVAYANALIQRILYGVRRLRRFPLSGRPVPEVDEQSIRELIVTPYRVIYRVRQDSVQIVTLIHGGRNLTQIQPSTWEL